MAGATFSRVKIWTTEVLQYADLNAEFDNILNNLNPAGMDGQQDTLVAMRATSGPNESVLATSLATEIQQIRYQLLALAGGNSTYWYSTPTTSLTDLKNAIGGALVNNRLVSGAVSANSSAPRFLQANGAADSIKLLATTTPFVYVVNGTSYTVSADVTLSSMSLAPSSQNTATASGANGNTGGSAYAAAESTKTLGEDGTAIGITAAGTAITGLVGSLAAFKLVHSATTEYFIGYVASSTQITNCFRGFFVDSSKNPVDRVAITDADVITVMKLTWLYLDKNGNLNPGYTNPTFASSAPSSPNTGDYWYDMTNATWKTFGGVSWAASNSVLVGVCIQDSSNCVAARAFNYYTGTDAFSNINIQWASNTTLQALNYDSRLSVNGNNVSYNYTKPIWDVTANLESGQSRTVSTTYYIYVSEFGQQYITTKKPYDMRGTLKGWYHPFENWRAVARCQLNSTGSGNFDPQTLWQYENREQSQILSQSSFNFMNPKDIRNLGLKASVAANALTITVTQADGASAPNTFNPVLVPFRGSTITTFSYIPRYLTSTLSITVPSSATLGQISAVNQYVWVYLVDNAGTIDIAVSGVQLFDENSVQSTTQVTSGATSGTVLYSAGSAATSKSIRLIGRCLVNEATAGTWASAPTQIDVLPNPVPAGTDWVGYTPTLANFAASANTAYSRRVGKNLEVQCTFTAGTTVASTASATPGYNGSNANVSIDTIFTGGATWVVGRYSNSTAGGLGHMLAIGNASLIFFGQLASVASSGMVAVTAQSILASSGTCTFYFSVPILGWSTYGPL